MATKATSSVISSISASQIQAGSASDGQVATFNSTTSTWVASAAPAGGTSSYTGINQSKTSNGYQILPGGLIIVWGGDTVSQQSTATVTFAKAFPTACLKLIACTTNYGYPDTGGSEINVVIGSYSKTGATLYTRNNSGFGYVYAAIGY